MRIKLTESQFNSIIKEGSKKNKKKDTTLCDRGKEAAKAKFDVYPSVYANGYAVQVRQGKMPDKNGNKRCSGKYCKGSKNESVEVIDESLDKWFDENWVNICRNKKGGGHPPCGRKDADKGGYPKCRKANVAAKMSDSEKKSACSSKRKAEKKDTQKGKGQKPVMTKSPDTRKKKNESVNIDRMMVTENKVMVSEGLKYHLDKQIPLNKNIYRYGSENYFELIKEVRNLYNEGKVDLSYLDEELVRTNIGKKGIYEGKEVFLNFPMEEIMIYESKYNGRDVDLNSPKKSGSQNYVYVTGCLKDKNKVKKINYGSAMKDKLTDSDRRKAYSARHGCVGLSLKDKCTKKYWACRKPKDFAGVNDWW